MANFSFGTSSTPIQQTAPAASFGATGFGTSGSSFSFGAPTATTTSVAATGQTGFFSTPTTSAPGLGSFTAQNLGSSLSFGKPTQSTTALPGFGVSSVPTLGLLAAAPSQGQTTFDFSKGIGAAQPFNAPAGGLGGTSALAGTTGIGGGFGAGIGGGLGGLGGNNLFGSTNFSTQPTSTASILVSQPQSVGLGGDLNAAKPKEVEGRNENTKVKELQVPQDIVVLVENLKAHIKQQKEISSEIAKTPTRKLFNIQNDIENVKWTLSDISNLVDHNFAALKILKADTSETHQNVEMAQRTHETPPLLQYENTAPLFYFMNLVQKYESELIKLRNQVDVTEKHMRSLINPQKLTAEDLKRGMRQIHESFISLASRVQEVHKKVEEQKEQYLGLRKNILRDKTDVFEEIENDQNKMKLSSISSGPTPFSAMSGLNLGLTAPNSTKDSWLPTPNQPPPAFGSRSAFGTPSDSNIFGSGAGYANSTGFNVDHSAFNLQKPPLGAKRNKH